MEGGEEWKGRRGEDKIRYTKIDTSDCGNVVIFIHGPLGVTLPSMVERNGLHLQLRG